MKNNHNFSLARFSALGIYLLIAFEFFYMASPFAMYFYSVYKPGLTFLNRFRALAWTTGFFMPHLVKETQSILLDNIATIGVILALLGFLFFVVCALQIYYSKFFKKTVVTGGIYKYVRHPQYTAFAICSFGLLLIWPRFITLFFYIVLLFVYYWLARTEEKECLQKFGKSYDDYKKRTARFLPLPARLKAINNQLHDPGMIQIIAVFTLVLIIALSGAYGIKQLSIKQLYSYSTHEESWISIYRTEDNEFQNLSKQIQDNEIIDSLITQKTKNKTELINYLLPAELYISEIPMSIPEGSECHVRSTNFNRAEIKVVITQGLHHAHGNVLEGNELIQRTLTLKPLVEVWIDKKSGAIQRIIDLPESERYVNIPEPIF